MCGIAGFWSGRSGNDQLQSVAVLSAMATAIAHRGPDSDGIFFDDDAGLGLAHRRLSIIDLSEAGGQPMESASGRFTLVYNGEIYNHLDLRKELAQSGHVSQWRGNSDSETLLAAIEAYGLEAALTKTRGMFALGLWDRADQSLTLARDRIGEKPLYYGRCENTLLFGSELKALKAHPSFSGAIDREAVSAYLRFGYVPSPLCIFKGLHKLPPGQRIRFTSYDDLAEPEAWWSLHEVIEQGAVNRFAGSADDLINRTEATLLDVVKSQMASDVPLGVFLSGGVDSSLVAAMMCKSGCGPVHSFSIGFGQGRFNEAEYAQAVADHLGTKHTEFLVDTQDALSLVDSLPDIYDEPFGDSSQLPTILLSRLAREHVTVALTGDGGDEIFGGYNRHVSGPAFWRRINQVPQPLRVAGASVASLLQSFATGERAEWLSRIAVKSGLPVNIIDKLGRFASIASVSTDASMFYQQIVSCFPDSEEWMSRPTQAKSTLEQFKNLQTIGTVAENWMALDTLSYLPDDILVKVDRASMSASLETRAPFLDARTIETAWQIPIDMKISGGKGKTVLREILWRHVPRSLVERPKQGFAIPVDDWLRGDLRDWADALLSPESIVRNGLLEPTQVSQLWHSHLKGKVNAGHQLWPILMLELWVSKQSLANQSQVSDLM